MNWEAATLAAANLMAEGQAGADGFVKDNLQTLGCSFPCCWILHRSVNLTCFNSHCHHFKVIRSSFPDLPCF